MIDAHTHFGMRKREERFEQNYDAENVMKSLRELGVVRCVNLSIFGRVKSGKDGIQVPSGYGVVHSSTITNEGKLVKFCCAPPPLMDLYVEAFFHACYCFVQFADHSVCKELRVYSFCVVLNGKEF